MSTPSNPLGISGRLAAAFQANALTPLLALLLAREGVAVVVHGAATEDQRVCSQAVFAHLGVNVAEHAGPAVAGQVQFIPTRMLDAGLERLLAVRRVVGLRNPGHSLV